MATSESSGGGGGGGGPEQAKDLRHPRIDRQWLEVAMDAHRVAFEHEMERKRQLFDRELQRFWRARGPTP
jgi:hypothetical protein